MNIIVCMKHVPDVEGKVTVEKGAVSVRALVPGDVISSLDLPALEASLGLRDKAGGRVTIVSIGGEKTEDGLRKGLAMGADNAILLCDAVFLNLDSFSTALVLAKAIAPLPHDLALCGQRADDTQSGLTGAYLAVLLGLPAVANVIAAELKAGTLRLTRRLERGNREIAECAPPALLAVDRGEKAPRHATIRGYLRAKCAIIKRLSAADLGLTPADLKQSARVKTLNITPPKPKMKGLFMPDDQMSDANKMMALMGGGLVQKKSNMLEGDPQKIAEQVTQFLKKEKLLPG